MTYGWEALSPGTPGTQWSVEEAPHLGHAKHLCDMAKRGVDLNTYKKLVKDAKFICKKCGRAAAKEENLCDPVPL